MERMWLVSLRVFSPSFWASWSPWQGWDTSVPSHIHLIWRSLLLIWLMFLIYGPGGGCSHRHCCEIGSRQESTLEFGWMHWRDSVALGGSWECTIGMGCWFGLGCKDLMIAFGLCLVVLINVWFKSDAIYSNNLANESLINIIMAYESLIHQYNFFKYLDFWTLLLA